MAPRTFVYISLLKSCLRLVLVHRNPPTEIPLPLLWHMQLQNRAAAYNIWNHINPTTIAPLHTEPTSPKLPELVEYSPVANTERAALEAIDRTTTLDNSGRTRVGPEGL